MTTLNDVLTGMVDKITSVLDPMNVKVRVYAGPANPNELAEDFARGYNHISVTLNGDGKSLDIPAGNDSLTMPVASLTAALSGTQLQGGDSMTPATATITFGGSVGPGVMCMFIVEDNKYVPFKPTEGMSLDDVATLFVDSLAEPGVPASGTVTATATGNVVTLESVVLADAANAITIDFRIGGKGTLTTAVSSQSDDIRVDVLTYNDVQRRLLADALDLAFREINFLETAEGPPCRLVYEGRTQSDVENRLGIYRRILHYTVQYSMTRSAEAYTVLAGLVTVESTL